MSATEQPVLHHVKLPRQRLRRLAKRLLKYHESKARKGLDDPNNHRPVTVVCISDTHNHQPDLPPGDVLLHAGDLTENGSFDELQAQLDYINRQPHRHKVVVAGNHDVLLDEAFLAAHPERRYNGTRTRADLRWGDITYLEHAARAELHFPPEADEQQQQQHSGGGGRARTVTVFGSPLTPRYGASAFQHGPGEDVWAGSVPAGTDIVLCHGPPRLHLDNEPHAGCAHLAREVARAAPRLVVFGHIHAGYGVEERVRSDRVAAVFGAVDVGWRGWGGLVEMGFWVCVYGLLDVLRWRRPARLTTMVNASLVGGRGNELRNEPVVVRL